MNDNILSSTNSKLLREIGCICAIICTMIGIAYAQDTPPFSTDHLQLWLRADSVELIDGKVSRWYDLSPNNYEIIQTTENARPSIIDSINNNPTITFRQQDFLYAGDILDLYADSWTWIIVEKTSSDGAIISKLIAWDIPGRWFLCSNRFYMQTPYGEDGEINFQKANIFNVLDFEYDRANAENKSLSFFIINNLLVQQPLSTLKK
mgnify:FL=1